MIAERAQFPSCNTGKKDRSLYIGTFANLSPNFVKPEFGTFVNLEISIFGN